MAVLVIREVFALPPSWTPTFRDFTLYMKIFAGADIVLESDWKDPVWNHLRVRGGMDFVDEIVSTGTQPGIRIDTGYRVDCGLPALQLRRLDVGHLGLTNFLAAITPKPVDVIDILRLKAGS